LIAFRTGPRLALVLALALVAAFGALRAMAIDGTSLALHTVGLGLGMGLAAAILPMLVRDRSPATAGFVTAVYATGLAAGAVVGSIAVIPAASLTGGWRPALVVLGIPIVLSVIAVPILLHADGPRTKRVAHSSRFPWRERTAWLVAVAFGIQSLVFWALLTWLPAALISWGWDPHGAAILSGLFQAAGLVAGFAVGAIGNRFGSRRGHLVGWTTLIAIGLLGFALAPELAVGWVFVVGAAVGAVYPLVLTLPIDLGTSTEDTGTRSAMMLMAGYMLASAGPVVLGVLRDATHSPPVMFVALAVTTLVGLGASWLLPPGESVLAVQGRSSRP
jgi:CP family cyanate transporter-like MFS transporter